MAETGEQQGKIKKSRIVRVLAFIFGLLIVGMSLVLAVLFWQAQRKPTGWPQYVALGSSYAAGIGLGEHVPSSPIVCQRTLNSYPQQLARLRNLSLVDMTCSGATTKHVLAGRQVFLGPQLDGLTQDTELVTITIGGNDVGYVGDLSFLARSKSKSLTGQAMKLFFKGPKTPEQRDYAGLRDGLISILHEIRRRSPRAQIVVVTYPVILPPQGTCTKLGISAAEAEMMRVVGERLAEVTRDAAGQNNSSLVDMQQLGVGHDVCASDPWVNGWLNVVGTPFHPNLAGAKATADAIAYVLGAQSQRSAGHGPYTVD